MKKETTPLFTTPTDRKAVPVRTAIRAGAAERRVKAEEESTKIAG